MIQVEIKGIHNFKKTHEFTTSDRYETYDHFKCTRCGLIGRRLYSQDQFILVSDTFSQKRIKHCERNNFVDKYLGKIIQTICKIHNFPQIETYSKHEIVKPPIGEVNGERGVWIELDKKPFKITDDEFIFALKPKRTNDLPVTRTRTKVKKVTHDWTYYAHLRVRTKHNIKPVRTIFKRKRTK
jgi:hypothetical protein